MTKTTTTPMSHTQPKPAELRRFHTALQQWYQANGRHDLPWRNTTDPYHIWVSEVMLQQTQVATVLARFYHPFLEKFPTVQALAETDEAEVLKAWEGLGYYSRARNLWRAARLVASEGGLAPYAKLTPAATRLAQSATHLPLQRLVMLPGIGRNTASAILAFAFHQPVAILEANVKRIVARMFALETPTEAELWAGAHFLLSGESLLFETSSRSGRAQEGRVAALHNRTEHVGDAEIAQRNGLMNPFDYNQSMMDLGSLICTPRMPKCAECPAASICQGKHAPETFPTKRIKKSIPTRYETVIVEEDAVGKRYLEQRDARLLGGLWGFPQKEDSGFGIQESVQVTGCRPESQILNPESSLITHTYSHFKLVATVSLRRHPDIKNSPNWFTPEEIRALALSGFDHKVLALVDKRHTAPQKPSGKVKR